MHDILKNLGLINHFIITYCMLYNIANSLDVTEKMEVEVLTGERSITLVFPKELAVELGVGKGDFLKCHVDNDRLIVEKMKPLRYHFCIGEANECKGNL